MVVKSGHGYYTSSSSDAGVKFGPQKDKDQSYLLNYAVGSDMTHYSVFTSSLGILIRTPLWAERVAA